MLIDTLPATIEVGSTESLPFTFDPTTYQNATGDTGLRFPTSVLTDISTTPNQVITLPDAPAISSGLIIQMLRGSTLTVGHTYSLVIGFTGTPSNAVWSMRTTVFCPV
jgi:hypothetical protein